MWRRRSFDGWRRRRSMGTRQSGFGYSFGTVLLVYPHPSGYFYT